MTELVPAKDIERIVGAQRHPTKHKARAVSAEQTVYILHSQQCHESGRDLRGCAFSLALDENGIDVQNWVQDTPVDVRIVNERVVPVPAVAKPARATESKK